MSRVVGTTRCPVAFTPAISHDQLTWGWTSVIVKGRDTPRGVKTCPFTPGATQLASLVTAFTVGPQIGQDSNSAIRRHTTAAGADIARDIVIAVILRSSSARPRRNEDHGSADRYTLKKVLITGATGFIGMELVGQLAGRGLEPRVLIRRPHRAALLNSYDVEAVQGDLTVPASLERAVRDVDTVIHLGGRASFESYDRLKPSIVDGTLQLARAAAASGVEHFVFASSLFVYGDQQSPIDGRTPASPEMGYGRAKLEAERGIRDVADASGMSVAALRLPHVYGTQSILFRQVRNGFAVFPGRLSNRCGQLHVTDAAKIIGEVAEVRWSGTSPVTDNTVVTWAEFFEVLLELYPYFRLVTLPRSLSHAGAAILEPFFSRRSRPTLYTKDTVVGFNLDVPVVPGLVWDEVGAEPTHPSIHEGIPAVLDGYVHYRWRHPILDHRRH